MSKQIDGMTISLMRKLVKFYYAFFQQNNIPMKKCNSDELVFPYEQSLAHCHGILPEIETFLTEKRRVKAYGWICWIQGCLVTARKFTINNVRNHNKGIFDEPPRTALCRPAIRSQC